MYDYIDWLLAEAYAATARVERSVNWITAGLVLGALLVWIA